MDKQDKPRICEVLGGKDNPLRIGEVFTVEDYPNRDYRDVILHRDGKLHNYLGEPCQSTGTRVGNKIGVNALYWLIDHPESVIRPPRFTEDEVAAMRVLYAAGVTHITREKNGELRACEGNPRQEPCTINGIQYGSVWVAKGHGMAVKLFPSIRPGQSVTIQDVVGRETQ